MAIKFPFKLLKNEIPKIFEYVSNFNNDVSSIIKNINFENKSENNDFIEIIDYKINNVLDIFYKYLTENKPDQENISLGYSKFIEEYKDKPVQIFFDKKSNSKCILDNKISKLSLLSFKSRILFIYINIEYIKFMIKEFNIIFNQHEYIKELIYKLDLKIYEYIVIESNRIEKISKIHEAIEESFVEYKKLRGIDKALKKFASFIQKSDIQTSKDYCFKNDRELSYFINYHEECIYFILNNELCRDLYNYRGNLGFAKLSQAEKILCNKLENKFFNKVKIEKCNSNNLNENIKSVNYKITELKTKICKVSKDSFFGFFNNNFPILILDEDLNIQVNHGFFKANIKDGSYNFISDKRDDFIYKFMSEKVCIQGKDYKNLEVCFFEILSVFPDYLYKFTKPLYDQQDFKYKIDVLLKSLKFNEKEVHQASIPYIGPLENLSKTEIDKASNQLLFNMKTLASNSSAFQFCNEMINNFIGFLPRQLQFPVMNLTNDIIRTFNFDSSEIAKIKNKDSGRENNEKHNKSKSLVQFDIQKTISNIKSNHSKIPIKNAEILNVPISQKLESFPKSQKNTNIFEEINLILNRINKISNDVIYKNEYLLLNTENFSRTSYKLAYNTLNNNINLKNYQYTLNYCEKIINYLRNKIKLNDLNISELKIETRKYYFRNKKNIEVSDFNECIYMLFYKINSLLLTCELKKFINEYNDNYKKEDPETKLNLDFMEYKLISKYHKSTIGNELIKLSIEQKTSSKHFIEICYKIIFALEYKQQVVKRDLKEKFYKESLESVKKFVNSKKLKKPEHLREFIYLFIENYSEDNNLA